MKSREQFIHDIYRKSEVRKQKEKEKRQRIRKLSAGGISMAACLILALGAANLSDGFSFLSSNSETAGSQEQQISKDVSECELYGESTGEETDEGEMAASENETSKNGGSAGDGSSNASDNVSAAANSENSGISAYNRKSGGEITKNQYNTKTETQKGSVDSDTQKYGSSSSGSKGSKADDQSRDTASSNNTLNHQTGLQAAETGSSQNSREEGKERELPAQMIQINRDGSRTEIADENMQSVLQKILRLEAKQKAVWRYLDQGEPEEDYTKKILFVLYDSQGKNSLKEDDQQNIVWYVLKK